MIVHRLVTVEVDRPGEEGRGLIVVDLLLEEQRIGAQDDELLALDETPDDARHVLVEQRLTASDRDRRSAAFIDRLHALLIREALIQYRVGIVDLAAARARQIAAEQGLEHQHQRIFAALEVLLEGVGADTRDL
jgi:hypothetical protein